MRSTPSLWLVDAFSDESEMYAEYLSAAGFRVRVLDSPAVALAEATSLLPPPDVLVTRIRQPKGQMDGIALTASLRQHPATRDVAMVVITTSSAEGDREAAVSAGCNVYLLLPTFPEALLAEIRRVLRERAIYSIEPKPLLAMPKNRGTPAKRKGKRN